MPPLLLFFLGMGIIVFFIAISIHYIRIEKKLRDTYISTEIKVKKFLEKG
jgi:Na+-transporting methylmalonyl-CoA/oxaloacetate decarboxylase gamma subunit